MGYGLGKGLGTSRCRAKGLGFGKRLGALRRRAVGHGIGKGLGPSPSGCGPWASAKGLGPYAVGLWAMAWAKGWGRLSRRQTGAYRAQGLGIGHALGKPPMPDSASPRAHPEPDRVSPQPLAHAQSPEPTA